MGPIVAAVIAAGTHNNEVPVGWALEDRAHAVLREDTGSRSVYRTWRVTTIAAHFRDVEIFDKCAQGFPYITHEA